MPTNAIGAGTCNIPVNVTLEARSIIGRRAFQAGVSIGEWARRAFMSALSCESPADAVALERAERRRRVKAVIVLLVGILSIAQQMFFGGDDMRRPVRGTRTTQSGKGVRRGEAAYSLV